MEIKMSLDASLDLSRHGARPWEVRRNVRALHIQAWLAWGNEASLSLCLCYFVVQFIQT
jgi:hypothetical protein